MKADLLKILPHTSKSSSGGRRRRRRRKGRSHIISRDRF
jgi:hypothetical protein